MAVNYVKFQRGSQAAYDLLVKNNRADDNTLYFIYPEENGTVGKLYLGTRLISGGDVVLTSASLNDLADVITSNITNNSFLVAEITEGNNAIWRNRTLSEVIELIKSEGNLVDELSAEADGVITLQAVDNKIIGAHAKQGPVGGAAKGATADQTLNAFGNSIQIKVPHITVNEYGHTTALEEKTLSITLPEHTDENTTYELKYDDDKYIRLYDDLGSIVSEINADVFIKDGMLQEVSYNEETNELTFIWNTDAGKTESKVKLTDILEPYSAGNGINISGNEISIKLDPVEKNYLVVDDKGLRTTFDLSDYATNAEAKANSGIRYINQTEIDKLSKLTLDGEDITISGSVEASQVKNLYTVIENIVTGAPGEEDLNPDVTGLQQAFGIEKGAQKNFINSIDENKFIVNDGKLLLKEAYITSAIYQSEVGNLSQLNLEDGRENVTLVDEINYINQRLTWGEIDEI